MFKNTTDKAWEYFGKTDPYFGVLTSDDFRTDRLTPDARRRFFESGSQHIADVLDVIHQHIDPAFMPTHALDFGCGVGRLVIPLAKICSSVTGIDISEAMLAEARNNCQEQKISNVNLVKGDDSLSGVPGTFDFIHSFIVFQHIPQQRGEAIFRRLVGMLQENGIGVVHFTYAQKSAWHSGALVWLYEHIPLLLGVRNLLKGRAFGEPMMQMNEYNLNRIFEFLQDAGCHHALIRFTDHGVRGIVVFFQQKRLGIL